MRFLQQWTSLLVVAAFALALLIASFFVNGRPGGFTHLAISIGALGLGLALPFMVVRWSAQQWAAGVDSVRTFLPVLSFFLTLVLVDSLANTSGTAAFYATSAQIIPVLVLGLSIEGRLFRVQQARDPGEMLLAFLTMGALAFGEYYALKAVFTGNPTDAGPVAGAIAAGLVGIAVLAVSGPRPSDQAQADDPAPYDGDE